MVCVALVLVLVIGINEVFRLTSDTIGAGQAVSNALRDERAVRQTFDDDFAAVAPDSPYFIIHNEAIAAFRTREDQLANAGLKDAGGNDLSNNPAYLDLNGNGIAEPGVQGEFASPVIPSARMHRVDTISFMVRRSLRRQTGNVAEAFIDNTVTKNNQTAYSEIIGKTTSSEAAVTYGHLRLPNNNASSSNSYRFYDPGEPDVSTSVGNLNRNDNNKYATQLLLGRSQMLLIPVLYDGDPATGTPQNPGETAWSEFPLLANSITLAPLAMNTGCQTANTIYNNTNANPPPPNTGVTNTGGKSGGSISRTTKPPGNPFQPTPVKGDVTGNHAYMWESKQDVAVTSISDFGQRFANYRAANYSTTTKTNTVDGGYPLVWPWYLHPNSNRTRGTLYDQYALPSASGGFSQLAVPTLSFRWNATPFGIRTGNDGPQTLNQTHPILLPRVSQFIIEYAGDFLKQQTADGGITAIGADGEVDFVVFAGQKRIRWYGLPRYTGSGNVALSGSYVGPIVSGKIPTSFVAPLQATVPLNGAKNTNTMPDVVPLSDVLTAFTPPLPPGTRTVAPIERVIMPKYSNFGSPNATSPFSNNWMAPAENYADMTKTPRLMPINGTAPNGNPLNAGEQVAQYVCAWAGGGPKMIRITITLEDTNPKNLSGGKTYEYVYALPY